MSRPSSRAAARTQVIAQHMMSTTASPSHKPILFETNQGARIFTLNRPEKLNVLNDEMLQLLRPKIAEWSQSDLCGTIIGTGAGRAFCAGGDIVQVGEDSKNPETRHKAIDFFHKEFELDYILAGLDKPYVAILDGFTMGGGVGLSAHAPFRIATENTVFAMPETKIGYFPDVGATYFLSKLDGYLGTYLAMTSETIKGRGVFELGFATHYIPSRRVPILISRLAALDNPSHDLINSTIEEFCSEEGSDEASLPYVGDIRVAIDSAFCHDKVEHIIRDLNAMKQGANSTVAAWAEKTLTQLNFVSPTSLKVTLQAIRNGRNLDLLTAFQEELKLSTAFCNGASADFTTGIDNLKSKDKKNRAKWSPEVVDKVSDKEVKEKFFSSRSEFTANAPSFAGRSVNKDPMAYALPTEAEIAQFVRGSHKSGGDSGITLPELVSRVEATRPGKLGVRKKVEEVAERQCRIVDNNDGNFVWLNWAPKRWESRN